MYIKLSPVRRDERLIARVDGDTLTVNGVVIDFSDLPEGALLPVGAIKNEWVAGEVTRLNGEIRLTLVLPHGAVAPMNTLFPEAFNSPLHISDGHVPLPPYEVSHD